MIAKALNYARFFKRLNRVLKLMKGLESDSPVLVPDELEATIDRVGDKTAFIFEGQSTSFKHFEIRSNKIANWALGQGLKAGDTVALVMENCPDYPAVWFGLSKVGVVTALINCNLEGKGLTHCINIVNAKAVIAAGPQAAAVQKLKKDLNESPRLWGFDGHSGEDFEVALEKVSSLRPSRKHRAHLLGKDTCVYIYTSGTTGLPKAAKLVHSRMRRTYRVPIALAGLSETDRVYNVLPLYHMTGGAMAMGSALFAGATTILKRKFSTSEFWSDAADHKATLFVYIGELCRYLLNSESRPKDLEHNLRAGFGNGLRGDVWAGFVERFNVPSMRELYGSTEGNVAFLNLDGKVGAVGQLPRILDRKMGAAFVKFDVEAEMPVRDKNGFCIKCDVDEVGEVIGRISESGRESFQGYHDKKETDKKVLRDVFENGDQWFRTGDLMRRDEMGYVYFVDRIGDTFRWKGENVATNEVGDIVSNFDGVDMANVYGVEVPGCDGRAGMASVILGHDIEFTELATYLKSALPAYAVPLFIRVQQDVDTTGTFKFRKVEAVKEGFDVTKISDPIWFLDPKVKTYGPLSVETFTSICANELRI